MKRAAEQQDVRFERLFNQTRDDLLAYALRRAKSPEDAADVLAETFLIAWRKLEAVPPGDQARLWLFGVARNLLRQGARRERGAHATVERLGQELRDAVATVAPPEDERTAALRAALEDLPEPQREAILLTAWEELSPRQIAAVTGAPVNLVRVRLHRARARLRRALATARLQASTRASPARSHNEMRRTTAAPESR